MRTGLTPLAAKQDEGREQGVWRRRFGSILTELAIWLPLSIAAGHVVLFTAWTTWVSFTASSLMPDYTWVGLRNYWAVTRTANFQIAYVNLLIFGFGFVLLTMALGLLLAILLDQRVRGENVLRTIFLYPLAVSFVVTGTVWSWLLNPGLGLQRVVQNLGWQDFRFDWLVQSDKAIYTLIFAGVWQGAGFAMALFLAGLRSVDADLVKAAQTVADVSPRVAADHLADFYHRVRDPVAVRDHVVRPGSGADRRRTGYFHHAADPRRL